MRPILFVLAALVPVLDRADAQDLLSTLQFPTSSRQIYGDAPVPNVKSPKGGLGMSSAASIGRPFYQAATASPQKYGDAAARRDLGKSSGGGAVGKPSKAHFATGRRAPAGSK
jgi:hypothetical protein